MKLRESQKKMLTEELLETPKEREMRMSRERAKRWREANKEKHIEYTRQWKISHSEATKEQRRKYYNEHLYIHHANSSVYKATVSGKLVKPDCCSRCEKASPKIHGHHDNYNDRLSVIWLCPLCHKKVHRERMVA